jgi:hypothetical protein
MSAVYEHAYVEGVNTEPGHRGPHCSDRWDG